MDKRWLSQLLNDAAFPALALAVAASQVKVGAPKKSSLAHYENQPTEVQLDGRFQENAGNHKLSTPSRSPWTAERPVPRQTLIRKE
jgi:hypothetical protein